MRWRCDPISQSAGEPAAHARQRPQAVTQASATASPTRGARTPGPTASTMPGALVPEHQRQVVGPDALHHVQIGPADARCGDAHAHLAGVRLVELDLLDAQRGAGFPEHSGARSASAQHRQRAL